MERHCLVKLSEPESTNERERALVLAMDGANCLSCIGAIQVPAEYGSYFNERHADLRVDQLKMEGRDCCYFLSNAIQCSLVILLLLPQNRSTPRVVPLPCYRLCPASFWPSSPALLP